MKRLSNISLSLVAIFGLVSNVYASAESNLNYSCSVIADLAKGDSSFKFKSGESCSFSLSVAKEIQSKNLPIKLIFRGVESNYTFLDVAKIVDNDKNIKNGITITAKSLDSFVNGSSKTLQSSKNKTDKNSILSSLKSRVFYAEIGGGLYKVYFDSNLEEFTIKQMIVKGNSAKESQKEFSFRVDSAVGDRIKIAGEEFKVIKRRKGIIKLISNQTSQAIKMIPNLKKAIRIYKRRERLGRVTKVSLLNNYTDSKKNKEIKIAKAEPSKGDSTAEDESKKKKADSTNNRQEIAKAEPAKRDNTAENESKKEKADSTNNRQEIAKAEPAKRDSTTEDESKKEKADSTNNRQEIAKAEPAKRDNTTEDESNNGDELNSSDNSIKSILIADGDGSESSQQSEPTESVDENSIGDDNLLSQEQNSVTDTETGKVQNYDKRMARMVQEYKLVLNLVSKKITCESINSGAWSSPSTWRDGKVPSDGDRVLINKNHRVVINTQLNSHIRTIKVEGELAFNPHKNTRLYVDTMVTLPGSVLRIGEPRFPIDEDKRAEIIISDYNEEGMITNDPSSPDYDPLRIGQGILTNGLFLAHGADKTPYVAISGKGVSKGATEIYLEEAPEGWRVGDEIVINGVSENGIESELRKIVSIDDDRVVIDKPLDFDHIVPDTTIDDVELKVHIANLSRNIIIKSDKDILDGKGDKNDPNNVEHRGHVLFMHNNNVNINDVEFKDLGRTNKKYPLDETEFASSDANARAVKIGTNQAARYPVHFHRAGLDGKIGRVNECVVFNSPGWGYVNHSSNVLMRDNIAYGVYGASFITEAGDENGVFEGNMAIATRGVGAGDVKSWKSREKIGDWGFQGNGFWLLGKNVDVVNNIVVGSSNTAFALAHRTIDDVTGVVDSSTKSEKPVEKVALKSFVGNIAYGNSGGVLGILSGTRHNTTEKISGLLAYSNRGMGKHDEILSWWYPDNIVLDNIVLIGDIHNPRHTGVGTQTKLRKTIIRDSKIEGFEVGLRIPEYVGPNVVENMYLNNIINMYYRAGTTNKGANTRIQGRITYGALPIDVEQKKIKFDLNVRDVSFKNYWNRQYNRFNIIYAPEGETPMKLYMTREQSPDFIVEVGDQKGKSNSQLISEGHRPVGGELLPENAVKMEGMENVSGVPLN